MKEEQLISMILNESNKVVKPHDTSSTRRVFISPISALNIGAVKVPFISKIIILKLMRIGGFSPDTITRIITFRRVNILKREEAKVHKKIFSKKLSCF